MEKEKDGKVGGKSVSFRLTVSQDRWSRNVTAQLTRGAMPFTGSASTNDSNKSVEELTNEAVEQLKANLTAAYSGSNVAVQPLTQFIDKAMAEAEPSESALN